jgi:hypothetical protein
LLAVIFALGCKGSPPAPTAPPPPIDATVIDVAIAAPVDAAPVDAAIDAAIDAAPPQKPRAKKKSRSACLDECRKRNMYTDCAGDEGGMMPCPCNCD